MTELLFPRLPPAVARRLFDDLKALGLSDLRNKARTSHPDAVFAALGGADVDEKYLNSLATEIREAAKRVGYPDKGAAASAREQFDIECAELLHRRMHVVPAEAASIDVWAFIGAVLLPDVSFWRFPDPPQDRVIGPDLTRHAFARLWWRAYQLVDLEQAGGLSALASIPENAMNQLFERRNIGGNRALVRAIARAFLAEGAEWSDVPRRQLIRDVTYRIQRLLAFSMLEAVDDAVLDKVIRELFLTAADALRRDSQPDDESPLDETVVPIAASASNSVPNTTKETEPAVDLDHVPLANIPLQIAELVNSRGGVSQDDLVAAYQQRYDVEVPQEEHDLINKFAWSANGRKFITIDEEHGLWLPGERPPAPVEKLGDWTIDRIRVRARELLVASPNEDPFEQLVAEVYDSNGGRVPRLVMSLVGRIINAERRAQGRTSPRAQKRRSRSASR